jgi:hypothetical protein
MKITVKFESEVPAGISRDEIIAWLAYRLGIFHNISDSNPLAEEELNAIPTSLRLQIW